MKKRAILLWPPGTDPAEDGRVRQNFVKVPNRLQNRHGCRGVVRLCSSDVSSYGSSYDTAYRRSLVRRLGMCCA